MEVIKKMKNNVEAMINEYLLQENEKRGISESSEIKADWNCYDQLCYECGCFNCCCCRICHAGAH